MYSPSLAGKTNEQSYFVTLKHTVERFRMGFFLTSWSSWERLFSEVKKPINHVKERSVLKV